MHVTTLELADFRCYEAAHLELTPGVTVLVGGNGSGKTSLLEALAWGALGHSFRGVADAALVRAGAQQAIVRVEVASGERRQLMEAELHVAGRNRVLINRRPLARTRDLLGVLRVTVFAPDDLELVKGGPSSRRGYLDDLLVSIAPRYEANRADYERILRQRNALLKGCARDPEALATLEVFDHQLARAGAALVHGRLHLVERLAPGVDGSYRALAGAAEQIGLDYRSEWFAGRADEADLVTQLHGALVRGRAQEQRRGLTLVGPHRDELRLAVDGLDGRTQASQGEQRCLALALRLAGHRLCIEVTDEEPVLLLDDVLSELDPARAGALLEQLSAEQTLLTTAGTLPEIVRPTRVLRVGAGRIDGGGES